MDDLKRYWILGSILDCISGYEEDGFFTAYRTFEGFPVFSRFCRHLGLLLRLDFLDGFSNDWGNRDMTNRGLDSVGTDNIYGPSLVNSNEGI